MSFSLAVKHIFDNPKWFLRLVLAALFVPIPIIGQLYLLGWAMEVVRRVIEGEEETLPELEFSKFFKRGFFVAVITIAYLIIPSILLGITTGGTALGELVDNETLEIALLVVTVCLSILGFIFILVVWFIFPAVFGNFVAEDKFSAGFNLKQIFALLKAAPATYLAVLGGSILAAMICSIAVVSTVVVTPLNTLLYAPVFFAILTHMWGQAYLKAKQNLDLKEE